VRAAHRLGGRHAAGAQVVGARLHVELQLGVDVLRHVVRGGAPRGAEQAADVGTVAHAGSLLGRVAHIM